MKVRVKTTWSKLFERAELVLFNQYPNIATLCEEYGSYDYELENFCRYAEEEDEEPIEIYQWYIIGDDFEAEYIKEICPEVQEDIQWSEIVGHYILAVRHFGTGWSIVNTIVERDCQDEHEKKLFIETYSKEDK